MPRRAVSLWPRDVVADCREGIGLFELLAREYPGAFRDAHRGSGSGGEVGRHRFSDPTAGAALDERKQAERAAVEAAVRDLNHALIDLRQSCRRIRAGSAPEAAHDGTGLVSERELSDARSARARRLGRGDE